MKIVKFDFKGVDVRVVEEDGSEPMWLAKDVCSTLGLENVTEALRSIDADEKRRITLLEPDLSNPESGGIPRTYVTVTEAGVYTLILKSTKPQAKEFRRWVTHEVLPRIREHGAYWQDGDEARVRDVLDRILLHKDSRARWELLWRQEVVKAIAPLYGRPRAEGRFPLWMASIIHKLYDGLFGEDTMAEARHRRGAHTGKGNLLTQYLTDDAKEYLRNHIDAVRALALTSRGPEDFWDKVATVFGKSMFQPSLLNGCTSCGASAMPGQKFCSECGAKL